MKKNDKKKRNENMQSLHLSAVIDTKLYQLSSRNDS